MSVISGAEPFSAQGRGDRAGVGVLFCHGFTGSPQGLRDWAERVADAGYTVRLPLLPGHGRTWQELAVTDWTDWFGEVERHALDLAGQCRHVVVVGLSMGGALALRLAQVHPTTVTGVVLVNPSVLSTDRRMLFLPVLRRLRRSVAAIGGDIRLPGASELAYARVPLAGVAAMVRLWRTVRPDLPLVTAPLLLARSAHDRVVPDASCDAVLREVSSSRRELLVLPDSGHVATLDHDAATLVTRSLQFIGEVTDTLRGQAWGEDSAGVQAGGQR